MKRLVYTLIVLLALLYSPNLISDTSRSILLQGFHWESHMSSSWWKVIQEKSYDISKAGFDLIWLPPSAPSASMEGYLPHKLYSQDSFYGDAWELKKAISLLNSRGVKVIADIVINHRVGTHKWADFSDPYWGPDAVCRDDEWSGATGKFDTGASYHAGRDIDHTNPKVQRSIIDWLNWLKHHMGYDGWRYDYAIGYAGEYIDLYNKASKPYFSVAEYWPDHNDHHTDLSRQEICDALDSTNGSTHAFDFTTKGILHAVFKFNDYWRLKDENSKASGLIGWWPERAVTFVDNHDTGPSTGGGWGQNKWAFPSSSVIAGYAYILTHPGIPSVYWVHYFDWGLDKEIDSLISIRKKYKISSKSSLKIIEADNSKYAAIIDGRVAMKIGFGQWSPGKRWKLLLRGENYMVWGKKSIF